MIIIYDKARTRGYSATYVAHRDFVVADGGSIASATATQAAFDLLESIPLVQWLDARFGVRTTVDTFWYSLTGRSTDVPRTVYGTPMFGIDSVLNQATWAGGVFNGGTTPELWLDDDYTWGMRCYVSTGSNGFLWGDRLDSSSNHNDSSWNWLSINNWRSYNHGDDRDMAVAIPRNEWVWVWVVKQGRTVTGYVGADTVLFTTTLTANISALSFGIAGSTESGNICDRGVRYQAFLRAGYALSKAQRTAVMSV